MVELVDRRILGALRPTDAITGAILRHPVTIEGQGMHFHRTRSGDYAILTAPGLRDHTETFDDPPAAPPAQSIPLTLSIHDPTHAYMPRLVDVALPRPWNPAGGIRDLMQPIEVPLAASAARAPGPGWANVLAIVADTGGAPVQGALVEVFEIGGGAARLAWGLTHARGEALVGVPGLPAFREIENDPLDEEDDEVVTAITNVRVRATALITRDWPVNPATLAAGGPQSRFAEIASHPIRPGTTVSAPLTLNFT